MWYTSMKQYVIYEYQTTTRVSDKDTMIALFLFLIFSEFEAVRIMVF